VHSAKLRKLGREIPTQKQIPKQILTCKTRREGAAVVSEMRVSRPRISLSRRSISAAIDAAL